MMVTATKGISLTELVPFSGAAMSAYLVLLLCRGDNGLRASQAKGRSAASNRSYGGLEVIRWADIAVATARPRCHIGRAEEASVALDSRPLHNGAARYR